ncbi:T9SS type A sorting domain-containing protein [Ferruginibacter lapsinanis]|uniref:T9SS type A sorting domain-containing protein n=1 Tax=Ferruginibacter lapsinanis TaxID=563172 RepID=UPI001E5B1642|nr:T9SS type A sorting domain-containing protein [Ferruginibacter lapsinanis]UEG50951.1 T9SS type A sorting domain-containing protein [Ferruginibacter lapsinanis]
MTKNLLLLFFIVLLFTGSANAQYVNIPDYLFRSLLKAKYPSCFNSSDMMDTTCSSILSETELDVDNFDAIFDIEGIQYFKALKILHCGNNRIQHISVLPETLTYLDCHKNRLVSLSELPSGLGYLDCSNNLLSELPVFGKALYELKCYQNDLHCLPALPQSLQTVSLDTSYIHCVPNVTDANFFHQKILYGSQNYVPMQVCSSGNNINDCDVPSSLSGRVFYDNNTNGLFDAGDCSKADFQIKLANISPINNDSSIATQRGFYLLMPKVAENYTISTDAPPQYYKVVPASANVDFTNPGTTLVQNFALQSNLDNPDSLFITGNGGFTLGGFYNPMLFPSQNSWYETGSITLEYENRGTTTISPTITLNYDSSLIRYTFSSNAGVVDNGKTLILNESNLAPGEHKAIILYFSKDATTGNPSLGGAIWNFVTIASIVNNGMGNVIAINNQVIGLLPLKLATFTALISIDNSALLSWNTNDEINANSFIIEQSTDGVNFNYIASVSAKKQSNNSYNYKTDALATNAITYFRLKMIDTDGKFTYSSIIKVSIPTDTKSTIAVFPNPASQWIKIQTANNGAGNNWVRLLNSQGVLVKKLLLQQGTQTMDLRSLTAGVYYLQTPFGAKKVMIVK